MKVFTKPSDLINLSSNEKANVDMSLSEADPEKSAQAQANENSPQEFSLFSEEFKTTSECILTAPPHMKKSSVKEKKSKLPFLKY